MTEPPVNAIVELSCACANLRRVARIVTRIYDQELKPAGLETTPNGWRRIGAYGEFQNQSLREIEQMQMLNVVALTSLTRLALPEMLARKHGRILNLASVVAYQPGGPRMAVYYATKAFVLSFSKGLARELDGSGVSVTALSPGLTKSSFEQRAGASGTALYRFIPQMSARAVAIAGY